MVSAASLVGDRPFGILPQHRPDGLHHVGFALQTTRGRRSGKNSDVGISGVLEMYVKPVITNYFA